MNFVAEKSTETEIPKDKINKWNFDDTNEFFQINFQRFILSNLFQFDLEYQSVPMTNALGGLDSDAKSPELNSLEFLIITSDKT